MNRDEITSKLKERFCKNYSIPINIYQEPYFTDRIKLYDKYYNTIHSWNEFCIEMLKYSNEQDYFEYYNQVKQKVIDYIQSSEIYTQFNNEDMNKYQVLNNIRTNNIYQDDFIGKYYLSFDIKQANFSALSFYNRNMFNKETCFEDFISTFTTDKTIINSKYVRQVIFGACNPKRQTVYEKFLMNKILDALVDKKLFNKNDIVSFSNDEIITKSESNDIFSTQNNIFNLEIDDKFIPVRIECFKLKKINTKFIHNAYIKELSNREVKIKCTSPLEIPFVIRYLQDEFIQDEDFYFYYNNMVAKFII